MKEKRRQPRKRPDSPIAVTDTMTGAVIGRLGDASLEGMLLLAQVPIASDALYQVAFHLPDALGRLQPIEVGVHETWSHQTSIGGQSWVGFRFIDVGSDDVRVLREWLARAEASIE